MKQKRSPTPPTNQTTTTTSFYPHFMMSSIMESSPAGLLKDNNNQSQCIGSVLTGKDSSPVSSDHDAPTTDSGVPSHSNSPDGNSGFSAFSNGGSSGDQDLISSLKSQALAASLSGDGGGGMEGGRNHPSETPSPLFGSEIGGCIGKENDDTICPYCHKEYRQPRLLHCLHSLCEDCIIALLEGHSDGRASSGMGTLLEGDCCLEKGSGTESKPPPGVIRCPVCKQDSSVGNDARFAHQMLMDYVTLNLLTASNIDKTDIACQSCKTKERATARCQQCNNFICSNCEQAHDFMTCFQNHEVVKLSDIKDVSKNDEGKRVLIHQPIFCPEHKTDALKLYCATCLLPICDQCTMSYHNVAQHNVQKLDAVEDKLRAHLKTLMINGNDQVTFCQNSACRIESRAEELKNSVEMCRERIDEVFQEYKEALECRRVELQQELEGLHNEHEGHLNRMASNYEKTSQKISDACKFTERLLTHGNALELLLSEKAVSQQYNQLHHSVPKGDIHVNVEFQASMDEFKAALINGCGRFQSGLFGPAPTSAKNIEDLTKFIATPQTGLNTWDSPPKVAAVEPAVPRAQFMNPVPHPPVSSMVVNEGPAHLSGPPPGAPKQQEQIRGYIPVPPVSGATGSFQTPGIQNYNNTLMNLAAQLGNLGEGSNNGGPPTSGLHAPQPQHMNNPQRGPRVGFDSGGAGGWTMNMHHPPPNQPRPQHQGGPPNGPGGGPPFNYPPGGGNNNRNMGGGAPGLGGPQMGGGGNMPGAGGPGGGSSGGPMGFGGPFGGGGGGLGPNWNGPPGGHQPHHPHKGSGSSSPLGPRGPMGQMGPPNTMPNFQSMNQPPTSGFGMNQNQNNHPQAGHIGSARTSVTTPVEAMGGGGMGMNGPVGGGGGGPPGFGAASFGNPGNRVSPPGLYQNPNDGSSSDLVGQMGGMNLGNQGGPPPPQHQQQRPNVPMKSMNIKTRFGKMGQGMAEFNSPHGFCMTSGSLGMDDCVAVADTNNHRVQVFNVEGMYSFMFGDPGKEDGMLWYPRKVALTRGADAKFIVCDRGNERSRMQLFNKNGQFLRKIAIRFIDIVAGLAVDMNNKVVAVDSVSPTIFRIDHNGELDKWFDVSDYMKEPSDIAVSGNEYYVCDFKGHNVGVFDSETGHFLRRIGNESLTSYPNGIDVSGDGDVLVGDSHGNRFHVTVFKKDGQFLQEFECPFVKVSRCCGLRISSEGYIITLAKNNHHVLVLDTIYIQ